MLSIRPCNNHRELGSAPRDPLRHAATHFFFLFFFLSLSRAALLFLSTKSIKYNISEFNGLPNVGRPACVCVFFLFRKSTTQSKCDSCGPLGQWPVARTHRSVRVARHATPRCRSSNNNDDDACTCMSTPERLLNLLEPFGKYHTIMPTCRDVEGMYVYFIRSSSGVSMCVICVIGDVHTLRGTPRIKRPHARCRSQPQHWHTRECFVFIVCITSGQDGANFRKRN